MSVWGTLCLLADNYPVPRGEALEFIRGARELAIRPARYWSLSRGFNPDQHFCGISASIHCSLNPTFQRMIQKKPLSSSQGIFQEI